MSLSHHQRAQEGQARRGGGQAHRRPCCATPSQRSRDCERMAEQAKEQSLVEAKPALWYGVDRQEDTTNRGLAVPARPDPGGEHRPHQGGRQVRVQALWPQVLEPTRTWWITRGHPAAPSPIRPRTIRIPGPHDPEPSTSSFCTSRYLVQELGREPTPEEIRRRRWSCRSTRSARSSKIAKAQIWLEDAHRRRRGLAPGRLPIEDESVILAGRTRSSRMNSGLLAAQDAGPPPHATRGEGAAHALWHRREVRAHAGRGREGLRGDPRAHPADRSQGSSAASTPSVAPCRLKWTYDGCAWKRPRRPPGGATRAGGRICWAEDKSPAEAGPGFESTGR